jgi:hypothetical protein
VVLWLRILGLLRLPAALLALLGRLLDGLLAHLLAKPENGLVKALVETPSRERGTSTARSRRRICPRS